MKHIVLADGKKYGLHGGVIGKKFKIVHNCYHGDWKTDIINPRGTLEKGTIVTVHKYFTNFYGTWLTVVRDDGVWFDVKGKDLETI